MDSSYQLKEGDPARKFKGRGVLLGDQVKDQNMEAALFQDLGNSLATLDASRWADDYGCLPGNDVQMADTIQAYIQAKLSGIPCYCLMRLGILQPTVTSTGDLYAVWLRRSMDIQTQEQCGSNTGTPQYKRSDSDPSGMNGLRCIFTPK